MASPVPYPPVHVVSSTPGTADYQITGPVTAVPTYPPQLTAGQQVYYQARDVATGQWETGVLTVGADGHSLARTRVSNSSSGLGTAVNWAAGTREILLLPNQPLATVGSPSVKDFVIDYGADPTGVADCTTALNNALAYLNANGGGRLFVPAGKFLILSAITLPNDGTTPPKQANVQIVGSGAHGAGEGVAPSSGTIFDMRATGTAAKLMSLGQGRLEITGVTFTDGGAANGTPFILATNTTLDLHGCYFYGTGTAQDAVILGGTSTSLDGTTNAAFQGYGTVVTDNGFNKVRSGVVCQTYCNAVVITANVWWNGCGGDATHGAIEVHGLAGNTCLGGWVAGNLIEMTGYVYGIRLDQANNFTLIGNNFYDAGAGTLAFIRFEAAATYNTVIVGGHSDAKAAVSDASNGTNLVITGHQSQPTLFSQPVQFQNNSTPLEIVGPGSQQTTNGVTVVDTATSGNAWTTTYNYNSTSGFAQNPMKFQANGGSLETLFTFIRASATESRFQLNGSSLSRIQQPNGDLRIESKAGNTLWLGDSTNNANITNGILTAAKGLTAGKQNLTYGTTVTSSPASGAYMVLTVTDTVAFTMSAPGSATAGQEITYEILNSSGGVMGAITWNAAFLLAGAFTNPASTKRRTISFKYNGTSWVETGRAAADI